MKKLSFLVILVGVSLLITGLSFASQPVIKIGASVSLTGNLARFGNMVKNGYELWKDTVNSKGGVKVGDESYMVEIKYYDDQSNNQTAAKLTEKLITQDKVQFLLGPFGSGPTFATTAIAERYNVITIASCANSGKIYTRGHKNVFSIMPPAYKIQLSFLDMIKAVAPEPPKLAVIVPNDLFPITVATGVRKHAKKLGLEVAYYEEYPKGMKDLSPSILKVKHSGAKVLVASGYLEESILTVRQLKEQRVKMDAICFTTGPELQDFRENLGKDADNVFGVTWWMPDMKYNGPLFGSTSDYARLFESKISEGINQQAAAASQAGLLLQLAIENAGTLNTDEVRNSLKSYDGTTFWGPISWDKTGQNMGGSSVVFQIQKGKIKTVFPAEAAVVAPIYPAY